MDHILLLVPVLLVGCILHPLLEILGRVLGKQLAGKNEHRLLVDLQLLVEFTVLLTYCLNQQLVLLCFESSLLPQGLALVEEDVGVGGEFEVVAPLFLGVRAPKTLVGDVF